MTDAKAITVQIPHPLRERCAGAAELSLPASSVRSALDELKRQYPSLYQCICDETGSVRRHIALFVNKTLVRGLQSLDMTLGPGDVLTIMPAVSGG